MLFAFFLLSIKCLTVSKWLCLVLQTRCCKIYNYSWNQIIPSKGQTEADVSIVSIVSNWRMLKQTWPSDHIRTNWLEKEALPDRSHSALGASGHRCDPILNWPPPDHNPMLPLTFDPKLNPNTHRIPDFHPKRDILHSSHISPERLSRGHTSHCYSQSEFQSVLKQYFNILSWNWPLKNACFSLQIYLIQSFIFVCLSFYLIK